MNKPATLLMIGLSWLAACNRATSSSRPPASGSDSASPSAPTPAGFHLSGVVFENTPIGARPIPGGSVFFLEEGRFRGHVAVDATGRYTIVGLLPGSFVRVTWTPLLEVAGLQQIVPVNASIAGDTERDIEVVRPGSREFTCGSPTLSGVVFDTPPQGRRPRAGTRVVYTINHRWDGFDAYTQTDGDGRYRFCGIPRGVGRVGAGDCNDAALPLSVEVNGDTVADIDLTSFNASCP